MRNLADATNVGDARSLALAFARSRPLSAPKRGARESPTSPATKKIQITHLKMRAVEEERRVLRLGSRVERKEKNCREKRSERRQSDFGEKPSSRERSAREGEEREKKLIFFLFFPPPPSPPVSISVSTPDRPELFPFLFSGGQSSQHHRRRRGLATGSPRRPCHDTGGARLPCKGDVDAALRLRLRPPTPIPLLLPSLLRPAHRPRAGSPRPVPHGRRCCCCRRRRRR